MLDTFMTTKLQSMAFVCQAEVVEQGEDNRLRVSLASPGKDGIADNLVWAVLAIEIEGQLLPGDKVLITGESREFCYITGIIKRQTPRISTRTGSYAQVVKHEGSEKLQVRDKLDSLIFEYDAVQGRATLSALDGDLCLNAPNGEIQLFSSEGIRCSSLGPVGIDSRAEINLNVPCVTAAPESKLQLTAQAVTLSAPTCNIKARQANLLAEQTKVEGESLTATLSRSRLVIERLETVAGRVIQRAKDAFYLVENLQQTQAKKVRTQVSEDYYLKSGHTDIQADNDVKINGNKIHLG
jgi:hypothetical protein